MNAKINKVMLILYVYLFFIWTVRAACITITIDEASAVEFAKVLSWSDWTADANFHPLNSLWLWISNLIFSDSVFVHRIPNLFGGLMFLFAAWKIADQIGGKPGFLVRAFLVCNPFVNDFFSLARGYGLAMGFYAVFSLCSVHSSSFLIRHRLVVCALLAGLVVFSNYAFAMFVLPMLALIFINNVRTQNYTKILGAILICVSWGVPFIFISFELKKSGLLYYGGRISFAHDTVFSILQSFCYGMQYEAYLLPILIFAVATSTIIFCFIAAVSTLDKKPFHLLSIYPITLGASSLLVVISAVYMHTLFIVERTAICIYFLWVVSLFRSIGLLSEFLPKKLFPCKRTHFSEFLSFAGIIHILYCSSLFRTYSWFWDTSNEDFVLKLAATQGRRVIGVPSSANPGLNYYIIKHNLSEKIVLKVIDRGVIPSHTGITPLDGEYYGILQAPLDLRKEAFSCLFNVEGVSDYYVHSHLASHAETNGLKHTYTFDNSKMIWYTKPRK